MAPEVEAVLAELHARMAEEDELRRTLPPEEFAARRKDLMLAVGPETGRFLNLLVMTAGATRLLEIGTSVGYSTIWLAESPPWPRQ